MTLQEKKVRRGWKMEDGTPAESVQAFPHGASFGRAKVRNRPRRKQKASVKVFMARRCGRDRMAFRPNQ